jgi:AcrR family transcriptional regulator
LVVARPLSEEKREAILASAAELVAALGTGAPTAKIAKGAGVSEGTLFTYFSTKDEILNQLFLDIEADMARAMLEGAPFGGTPRERVREIWNRYIDWGASHPTQRRAVRQLKVSDRITDESRRRGNELFSEIRELLESNLAGHVGEDQSPNYVASILEALADTTHDLIGRDPTRYDHYRQAGFDVFWKGIAA